MRGEAKYRDLGCFDKCMELPKDGIPGCRTEDAVDCRIGSSNQYMARSEVNHAHSAPDPTTLSSRASWALSWKISSQTSREYRLYFLNVDLASQDPRLRSFVRLIFDVCVFQYLIRICCLCALSTFFRLLRYNSHFFTIYTPVAPFLPTSNRKRAAYQLAALSDPPSSPPPHSFLLHLAPRVVFLCPVERTCLIAGLLIENGAAKSWMRLWVCGWLRSQNIEMALLPTLGRQDIRTRRLSL